MTTDPDLVRALVSCAQPPKAEQWDRVCEAMRRAADEIERQRAEIERLRAELADGRILPDGYEVTYATEYANGTIQLTCKPVEATT